MKTDNHFTITRFYCTTWHGETHLFFLPEGLFCIMKHCKLISHSTKKHLSIEVLKKQGYKDSNLELTESESVALPFGDSPMCFVFRLPYRLRRMLLYNSFFEIATPFFNFFYFFSKFLKLLLKLLIICGFTQ